MLDPLNHAVIYYEILQYIDAFEWAVWQKCNNLSFPLHTKTKPLLYERFSTGNPKYFKDVNRHS